MSFITFEGGEGTGKTVQAKLLKEFLIETGRDVVLTREPGGTPLAEEIRNMLLTGEPEKIEPLTESLMYLAARSDHWKRKIKPALDANKIVISDRFHDSSLVYQGACKGVNISFLDSVLSLITEGQKPDRTYLIDLDPELGIARSLAKDSNCETRFEKMDLSFHEKIRRAFLDQARREKERFLIIDGALSIEQIHEKISQDILNWI